MTKDERQKLYAALAAPFPEEAIERTDGRVTGRGYSTTGIKYQYVVNRLNEVLGVGGYRVHRQMSLKEVTTAKGRQAFESACEIKVELGEWVDGQFKVIAEAVADGGHVSTSEADARKGAHTNAFKKCVAFFGVGREAYEGSLDDDHVPAEEAQVPTTPPSSPHRQSPPPRSSVTSPAAPGAADAAPLQTEERTRTRLTSKQLGLIWALAENQGYGQAEFRAYVKERFGVQVDYLNKNQASALITSLGQNGNGAAPADARRPGEDG